MRTRFTIQEPCDCGAEDCEKCFPVVERERDDSDAELDDLPDVEI